jgi:Entner-Doudoroff aldolase
MNPAWDHTGPAPTPADDLLDAALTVAPVVAILRGLPTGAALAVVQALYDAGVRIAEVPLNSPTPFDTIALLARHFGDRMVIGGGTVTSTEQVRQLAASGARLCVSPHTDCELIAEARRRGMAAMPGFATPSDAFRALAAGARHLKLFPAAGRLDDLKALSAVLPPYVVVTAVGGVTPRAVPQAYAAGARAFGAGSDLYRPGMRAEDVGRRARAWVDACTRQPARPALVCNPLATIGEGPVWRPARERLAWVDPVRRRLLSTDRDGLLEDMPLSDTVCALAALPSGALAGALEDGLCLVDETTGRVRRTASATLAPGCRFNDMCTGPDGGLWIGAMHRGLLATRGSLYHAAAFDAPVREVAAGLGVPNGMAYDAAGGRLYVIDTLARTLLAYPADGASGSLGEPVIVTDFMGIPGKPDGMARAADGSLWVAMWGGGSVVRIAPDGALLERVGVPAPHVSSVHHDPHGRLWITTSRMRLSAEQLGESPLSGAVFALDLGGGDAR